jgi:imidazolonepropionase-like amidohydrolase
MHSIFGAIVYTGKALRNNCYINFLQQKITSISTKPKGKVLGKYPVIIPALIDPHCHSGMMRAGDPAEEDEANEKMDTLLPLIDALDSVQMDDPSFADAFHEGVLYSCVLPGSGNIIGGRSALLRNYAATTTAAFIQRAGIKAAFGFNPSLATQNWKGTRAVTRMGAMAILRSKLDEVQLKIQKQRENNKKKAKTEDIKFTIVEKIYKNLLEGKEVLRCHVHKIDDIAALLRLVDEYDLRIIVEHACDVCSPDIFTQLAKRHIPVIYGPIDSFAYKVELKHENWRNIRYLLESGVKFGLMSDAPVILQRNLIAQLKWFLRLGLTAQQVIELVTRVNAEIIGADKILGTLEKGKWASMVCFDGDPLHLATTPVAIYGEGKLLNSESSK